MKSSFFAAFALCATVTLSTAFASGVTAPASTERNANRAAAETYGTDPVMMETEATRERRANQVAADQYRQAFENETH